jgi:hypothetical protein
MTAAQFLRHVREMTAFRHTDARPDYELHDSLWAQYRREVMNVSPQERETIERAIRTGTGC